MSSLVNSKNNDISISSCQHDNFEIIFENLYICKECSILIIKNLSINNQKISKFIKPQIYNTKYEINNIDIFLNSLNYFLKTNENNEPILSNELYIKHRKILCHHIKNLCKEVEFQLEIYYLSITLMDTIFNNINSNLNNYQLDLIGTTCFILSKKFFEIDCKEKENYQIYLTVCHSPQMFIKSADLINSEIKCLQLLNYNLNIFTPFNLLKNIFICGFVLLNEIKNIDINKIYDDCINLLDLCIEEDEICLHYNTAQIIFAIIYITRKKNKLTTNICKIYFQIFKIKFNYKDCAKLILKIYHSNNEKKIKIKKD